MDTKFVTRQIDASGEDIKQWLVIMIQRALARYSGLYLPGDMTFSQQGTLTVTNADRTERLVHVRVIQVGAQRSRVELQWVNSVHKSMGMLLAEIFRDFPAVKMEVLSRPDVQELMRAEQADPAPESPDQNKAGNPGRRAHALARERLSSGENEDAVRADWRKDYEDETGVAPKDTTSGERELWRNVKRGNK